jgi:hypothetical protein
MYSVSSISNTLSSDTLCGGLILLGGTGAVGGSSPVLWNRKLNVSSLHNALQSSAEAYRLFRQ